MNREPLIRRHPGDDSAWDLGHAYQAVGPGWWPLLRQAFAEIEAAGGEVTQVRQKIGHLDISARCKTGWLDELRDRYVNRSRVVCEVCGGPRCQWRNCCRALRGHTATGARSGGQSSETSGSCGWRRRASGCPSGLVFSCYW
jgi:hypothetical protein